MRKIISTSLTTLAFGAALSVAHADHHMKKMQGPYMGVSGGMQIGDISRDLKKDSTTLRSQKAPTTGATGGLFAGYTEAFENSGMLFGVEVFGNFDNAQHSQSSESGITIQGNSNATARSKFIRNATFGGALRLGKAFCNDYQAYVRVGVECSQFSQQYTATRDSDNSVIESKNNKQFGIGFAPGVGLERHFCYHGTNMSMRAEYSYSTYQRLNGTHHNGNETISQSASPSFHTIRLGLSVDPASLLGY